MEGLLEEVKKFEPRIIELRRRVHQNPELAYHEVKTASLVANVLRSLGVEVTTGVGGTGVLGVLKGTGPGKVVALRADMDALPVEEMVNLPFKSKVKGVMHACGHDSHVSMLLGAAMLLAKRRRDLRGRVKFLFQPAEEHGGRGGAKPMIEDGVMEDPRVNYVFGLHISNRVPSGAFGLRGGAFMAAPDAFKITMIGRGGHGSAPHETVDPIFVAAQVIVALQGISSRMIDHVKPFVISVCSIHSGTKSNIIPDEAVLEGTIRTLDEVTRRKAVAKVRDVAQTVASALTDGMKVVEMDPILGGEDFSRFLQKAPGTFYYLGTLNKSKGCVYPNHSSKFKVDEDVLKYGSVSLANLALEFARR
ncbi:MAG: amidohydrolase [Thaumarchaeota archaeon]|nr:MAG: amidohydrolase [Nitrososphaerota archaeon]